ncbi:MAG: sortase [Clostridia bacterium]|nr:sortase [Clostridia bacterium]
MGKHDSDEGLGFFLGGAEAVKGGVLWIVKNLKILLIVALIPAIGFGAYYATKYFAGRKQPETTPTYAIAGNITSDDKEEIEYVGGYEVLGQIKIANVGVDVKVLNPEIDGESYVDDSLEHGAILYYGEGLNELGNTVILGHNSSDSFFGLKELKVDDSITVVDQNGISKNYTVIEITNCEPDDFSKFLPMEKNSREITLITCESEGTQRLCIKAIAK